MLPVLARKNCIVTGGARGIGKAITKRFLVEGANVVFCDVKEEQGTETLKELSFLGNLHFIKADITKEEAVKRLISSSVEIFEGNKIDILVNNAGTDEFTLFDEISLDSWNKMISVNLTGTFLVSKEVSKVMKKQMQGVIINISSSNGLRGEIEQAHYNAAKAGVILLTKTIALELAKYNIRANSVCPGYILTELTRESGSSEESIKEYIKKIPIGRYGTPEDIAGVVSFLASRDASFITGTEILVDGGQLAQE